MNIEFYLILLIVSLPLYLVMALWLFGGWVGFVQAIIYLFQDDLVSAVDGEHQEDRLATVKLVISVPLYALLVLGEYSFLVDFFPRLVGNEPQ